MKTTDHSVYIETFGHNVAWLRTHYGLSKKRMAGLLGIGVQSLNCIEAGKIPPRLSVQVMFRIQKYFHISAGEQLTRRLGE